MVNGSDRVAGRAAAAIDPSPLILHLERSDAY